METIRRFFLVVFCATPSITPLLAQWVQTNMPYGAYVTAFAVSPASGGSGTNVFAGTSAGVFLSTDNGTRWTASGLTNTAVNALAVSFDGAGGSNLFAGTGGFAGAGAVYLSTDNGTSWTASGLTNTSVRTLAVSLASGGSGTNVFAGTSAGVFLSTDNGTTWTASGLTDTYVSSLAVSPNGAGGSNLFAGTTNFAGAGGVFLSTNNGTSWTVVNTGLTNADVRALAVSPNGAAGSNLFAGTWWDGGVFLSTNNGTTWTAVNTGLTDTWVNAFAVSGSNLFAGASGSGVWRRPLSEMITSVEVLSTNLPAHFSLSQNYPNPFNPATTIAFALPSKSFVSLKVFDALGREVATLISQEMAPGSYAQQWNAEGLPSGVYFCRMQAGSYAETKKLVLLK